MYDTLKSNQMIGLTRTHKFPSDFPKYISQRLFSHKSSRKNFGETVSWEHLLATHKILATQIHKRYYL